MRCRIFIAPPPEAVRLFNKWAKGKALKRDVIVHTIPLPKGEELSFPYIAILVYHPEDSYWEKEQTE